MAFCVVRVRLLAEILLCIVVLAAGGLLAGCGGSSSTRGLALSNSGEVPAARVSRLLIIGEYEVALDCALARASGGGDAAERTGAPLLASVRLAETRGKALPPELVADHLWLFHNGENWSGALRADSTAAGPGEVRRMAVGLPPIEAGKSVELVVRVRAPRGQDRFVRFPGVRIGRAG